MLSISHWRPSTICHAWRPFALRMQSTRADDFDQRRCRLLSAARWTQNSICRRARWPLCRISNSLRWRRFDVNLSDNIIERASFSVSELMCLEVLDLHNNWIGQFDATTRIQLNILATTAMAQSNGSRRLVIDITGNPPSCLDDAVDFIDCGSFCGRIRRLRRSSSNHDHTSADFRTKVDNPSTTPISTVYDISAAPTRRSSRTPNVLATLTPSPLSIWHERCWKFSIVRTEIRSQNWWRRSISPSIRPYHPGVRAC